MKKKPFSFSRSFDPFLDEMQIFLHNKEYQEELRVAEQNRAQQKIPRMFFLRMCHKDA